MKRQLLIVLSFVAFLCFVAQVSFAQDTIATRVKQIIAALNKYKEVLPQEAVYVQTDKSYYVADDTLWLKTYILNADLQASDKSGIVYIEFLTDSARVVKRMMVPGTGIGWGSVVLNKKDFTGGAYTLRCYTNWGRNFGEESFFSKTFYVGAATENTWLVNSNVHKDKQQLNITLQFKNTDQQPLALQDLKLGIYSGRHQLSNQKIATKLDGSVSLNFTLAGDLKGDLLIKAEPAQANGKTVMIPVLIDSDTDLQFMPEGGSLINGMPANIAFKAINTNGLGTDVHGTVTDSKQHQLLSFSPAHNGMGTFKFTPLAGETYTAGITLPDGTFKTYPLPIAQSWGTLLQIDNPLNGDSLILHINCTGDKAGSYMLIGQSRQTACYGATLVLGGGEFTRKISKNLFPTGIARFTLMDAQSHPLNERIVFIDHQENLNINITEGQQTYLTGDSIGLSLYVTDRDGKPAMGSFSMSITDDSQVQTNQNRANILTTTLLAGGIKGNIEEPAYYLNNGNPGVWNALDALLLTQGYTTYNWHQVTDTTFRPQYEPETEFKVHGKVTNLFGKAVKGSHVLLFGSKPAIVRDTVTDAKGMFLFNKLLPGDSVEYHLQARTRGGASFNVGITADEFIPPLLPALQSHMQPWYLNTDTILTRYIKDAGRQQVQKDNMANGPRVLKQVNIVAKKIIPNSHNLNGPGEADLVIDEKELQKAGKQTLYDLLFEKIKGVKTGMFPMVPDPMNPRYGKLGYSSMLRHLTYLVNEKEIRIRVDGRDLSQFYEIKDTYQFITSWLRTVDAEDIKGIELLSSSKYNAQYKLNDYSFNSTQNIYAQSSPIYADWAYLEITSRAGKGPMMQRTPGTYLYKPVPFALVKQFYSPKYTVKNAALLAQDTRSTIYWEPNIITNTEGKATVSFYAAGKPGSYTIILEGADLDGHVGYKSSKIKIGNAAKP